MPGTTPTRSRSSRVMFELHVPEAVDVERRSHRRRRRPRPASAGRDGRARPVDKRRPELGRLDAEREVSGGRREEIAPWKVLETGSSAYAGLASSVRARFRRARRQARAARCPGRRRDSPFRVANDHTAARSLPTPGSTTARWTPDGMIAKRVAQDQRAPAGPACGAMPCVMSMISTSGAMRVDHAVARPDEVVREAEVGEET